MGLGRLPAAGFKPRIELQLGLLALAMILLNLSFSMMESMITYYAANSFSMSPWQIGVLMALLGISAGAAQIAVRKLEGSMSHARALLIGVVIMAGELPYWPAARSSCCILERLRRLWAK